MRVLNVHRRVLAAPMDLERLEVTGAGVHLYSIDTGVLGGINGTVTTPHSDIAGRLGSGFDNIVPNTNANDCNGHGTHTAGTMADRTGRGVAPDARVLGVKVFQIINGQCQAYTSTQVAGINWAVAQRTAAINISISGTATFGGANAAQSMQGPGGLVSYTTAVLAGFSGSAQVGLAGKSAAASGFGLYGENTSSSGQGVVGYGTEGVLGIGRGSFSVGVRGLAGTSGKGGVFVANGAGATGVQIIASGGALGIDRPVQ